MQSGKRFVEIILLTKKSAARVKRRVEIICKNFALTEQLALPGKRSVENILLTKKPVALVKQSVESILLTKKPECPGKRSG